ncbi:MAG TPA: hypothetical protein ENG80_02455 [Nitrospirae bacterium]|nr:hypothetical protein BMS3Abin10_00885 [bacterium BMS3Abin10]GBE39982.1 hypothetical protein BMS3Bbin08_02618 [bacterium BMS3Bbin08]HDH00654.1 hypothetical protein [Nitrospirota bacterium]HDH50520.1 hypothetical protein [Nitrospirota bacterium]
MRKRPLQCPFCENLLRAPVDIDTGSLEITGGICKCSAVYVMDRTGHNLGQALMDALYFVCKEDYDRALSLMPEDYDTETYDYNPASHSASVCEERARRKCPKIIFMKLKETKTD